MDCTESLELLTEYISDTLDGPVRVRIEAHLIECKACDVVARDLRVIVSVAGEMSDLDGIPFPDEDEVWRRLGLDAR
jgi:hypothetical protein